MQKIGKPKHLPKGKGLLAAHELPVLRWLCRIVTEDRPADVPVDELRAAGQQSDAFFTAG